MTISIDSAHAGTPPRAWQDPFPGFFSVACSCGTSTHPHPGLDDVLEVAQGGSVELRLAIGFSAMDGRKQD